MYMKKRDLKVWQVDLTSLNGEAGNQKQNEGKTFFKKKKIIGDPIHPFCIKLVLFMVGASGSISQHALRQGQTPDRLLVCHRVNGGFKWRRVYHVTMRRIHPNVSLIIFDSIGGKS